MSSTKRRKIDPETMSNASGRNSGSNNASTSAAGGGGRRAAAGGPGSRGGHSAATASRAAAAVAAVIPPTTGPSSINGGNAAAAAQVGNIPGQAYVPVLPLSALPVSALSKYALHYGLVPPEPLTVAQATFPTPALPLQLKLSDSYTVPSTRAIGGGSRDREGRRNGRSPFISSSNNGVRAASLNPVMAVRAAAERSEDHSDADNQPSTSRLSLLQVNNGNGDGNGSASSSNAASTPINSNMAKSRSSSHQGVTMQLDDDVNVNSNAFASYGIHQSSEWTDPGEADALELRGMNAFEGGEEQLRERLGLLARTHWDKLASVKEAETVVNFAYAIRMRSKILKSAPMV